MKVPRRIVHSVHFRTFLTIYFPLNILFDLMFPEVVDFINTYFFLLATCINQESDEKVKLTGLGRVFLNCFWQLRKLQVLLECVVQELNCCIDRPSEMLAHHGVLTYIKLKR